MSVTQRGTNAALLQRILRRYSPTGGSVTENEFAGFGPAQMLILAQQFEASGIEYEWETRYGRHSMRAVDSSGATTIDLWEIGINKLSPSSFGNPRNMAAIAQSELMVIAKAYTGGMKIAEAAQALQEDTGFSYPDSLSDAGYRLYERTQKGSADYYTEGYVLRHTTNVSNRYSANIADFNINCIYTTAQLLSEVQNPSLWVYPMPGRLAYKLNALPAPPFQPFYLWGWLKSASSESTSANNRVNIVTEYELAHWSTDEYAFI